MSCYLPHKNKDFWKEKKKLFEKKINNIKEFKSIFYDNNCIFFDIIDKEYKNEGEEFINIFEHLQSLALNIEAILPEEIPVLKKGTRGKFELTRRQSALLFLLSFLNIIDMSQEKNYDKNSFCVFEVLYTKESIEFGRCFLNYLTIIGKWLSNNNPILEEKIMYIRDSKEIKEDVFKKETKLCDIQIIEKGSLFDGNATYGVDFANMYIGGGALNGGCVQEEILFATEPEAISSMFFMEVMGDNDAIRIDNTIKYSNYTGYGFSFEFKESAININNVADLGQIKKNKFIAIDASIQYSSKYFIIDKENIIRDIYKAYIGFNLVNFEDEENEKKIENKESKNNEEKEKNKDKEEDNNKEENKEEKKDNEDKDKIEKKDKEDNDKIEKNFEKSIATGNWGCGAFGGDHGLKFFQQWVAASFAGIDRLDYYTYESKKMELIIKEINNIKGKYKNANQLYEDLISNKLVEEEVLTILLNKDTEKSDNNFFSFLKFT